MGFIVVGLDGSNTSRKAFREAIREATWRECSLQALHVTNYPIMNAYAYSYLDLEALRRAGRTFLDEELALLADEYDGAFPVPVEHEAVLGHPGVEITRAAEGTDEAHAELVVLGSRGLGGIRGVLLGSVTTYAIHHLPCEILVVPAQDEDPEDD
jgi:nucleotide-binding universal stress UspA family protein